MKTNVPCIYCGQESVALCDAILGWPFVSNSENVIHTTKRGNEYVDGKLREVRTIDQTKTAFTCDAPLCASCVNPVAITFFCGKAAGLDFTDLCKEHKTEHPWATDIPLIEKSAADITREQIHRNARQRGARMRLRLVAPALGDPQ